MNDIANGYREELGAAEGPCEVLPRGHCLNCQRGPLDTPFCPECGQENADRPAPLRTLFHEVLEEFFKWDGRLFATLRLLLFKPGELTRAYNEGRRVRYLSPFKMYFVVSAIFFALITGQLSREIGKVNFNDGKPDAEIKFEGRVYPRGTVRAGYEAAQKDPNNRKPDKGLEYAVKRGVAGLMDSPGEFFNSLMQNMAKALVVLLPVYAGLLAVLYWRQKRYFVEHLVFAAHVQTFGFFLLTAADLLLLVFPFSPVLALLYPFYEFKALRSCYGSTPFRTWLRQQALALIYLFALAIALSLSAFTTLVTG
jgi:hypothetical protein